MRGITFRFLCSLATMVFAAQAVWSAQDTWPSKSIRMIVPFPPGGAADATARVVADGLRAELGQPIVVDNRSGAAGNIGAALAAKATPDGYTIVMANSSIATNVSLYKNLP